MTAAQAAENHSDEWGLTWYYLCGICTSIATWTQNLLKAAEATSLNISSHGTPLKWSQFNIMGHLCESLWIWWKVNGNWDERWSEVPNDKVRQSHCRTNASIRRNKKIQKSRTMIITVWDLFFVLFLKLILSDKAPS